MANRDIGNSSDSKLVKSIITETYSCKRRERRSSLIQPLIDYTNKESFEKYGLLLGTLGGCLTVPAIFTYAVEFTDTFSKYIN